MQHVAVISDTHVPERASEIPEPFRKRIRGADRVIHAGDFTTGGVLAEIESLADGELTAVRGNMDSRDLDLPEVATLEVEDVTVVVSHGTGSPKDWEERVADTVRAEAGEEAIGIAGHTHEALDAVKDGVRLLNPGSVTGAPPASRPTMMTVEIDGGDVEVVTHEH